MKIRLHFFRFLLILQLVISAPTQAAIPQIVTLHAKGNSTDIHVVVAETPKEQERGLMGQKELAENQGMLFIFWPPRVVSMWMKDTPLSLDIIFIGEDQRVMRIHAKAMPMSEDLIRSGDAVTAVLEVPAGTAERIGLKVGDEVSYAPVPPPVF